MKRRVGIMHKALLRGCLCLSVAVCVLAGCTDYQDDIDALQQQIDLNKEAIEANSRAIAALMLAFDNGVIIESVTSDDAGGLVLTTSDGNTYRIDKGEQGDVPLFSVDGNGCLIATWTDGTADNLGKVTAEVPAVDFSIDGNGQLIFNGQNLGKITGEDAVAPVLSFALSEAGGLSVTIDGVTTQLGNIKGDQGLPGVDAVLPSISFYISDGKLYSKVGQDAAVELGTVAGELRIENGSYWYNGQQIGQVSLNEIAFNVVNDTLYVAGNSTGIVMNQQIYMVDNADAILLNIPLQDGTYQTVELPKAAALDAVDAKLLSMIQSLVYIPDYADGKATQGMIKNESGQVFQSNELKLSFRVTPKAAARAIADLFASDADAVTLHRQTFDVRGETGRLEIDRIDDVDESTGTFCVHSSSRLDIDALSESCSVYLAIKHVDETHNIDIASHYIPVQLDVLLLSELELLSVNPSLAFDHELYYDDASSSFELYDEDYEVFVNKDGTIHPLADYGFSADIAYALLGKVALTAQQTGVQVTLAPQALFGETYNVSVGADLTQDGVADLMLADTHKVKVVRGNNRASVTLVCTAVWNSQSQVLDLIDDAQLSGMPAFFLMSDMDEVKTAFNTAVITKVWQAGSSELSAVPDTYLSVKLAANAAVNTTAGPYVMTAVFTDVHGWEYTVNIQVVVNEAPDVNLVKSQAWWTGEQNETLRIGSPEITGGVTYYTAVLNNAFQLELLNSQCTFSAELASLCTGVSVTESAGKYSITFTQDYTLSPVYVNFKVRSATDPSVVVTSLDNVLVDFPLSGMEIESNPLQLTGSAGVLHLGTNLNIKDIDNKSHWNGATGLSSGSLLFANPVASYVVSVPSSVFSNLQFNAEAVPVRFGDTYVVSNCTTIALASRWVNPDPIYLDCEVTLQHNWLPGSPVTRSITIIIPIHAASM